MNAHTGGAIGLQGFAGYFTLILNSWLVYFGVKPMTPDLVTAYTFVIAAILCYIILPRINLGTVSAMKPGELSDLIGDRVNAAVAKHLPPANDDKTAAAA